MNSFTSLHLMLFALLSLCFVIPNTEGKSTPVGSTKVLPCDASLPDLLRRTWARGYFNTSHSPSDEDVLFILIAPPGPLTRVNARDDMTVDKENFTLSIGDVQYEDSTYFTCIAEDFVGAKHYVQSEEIVVGPSTVIEVNENANAEFGCVFDKVSNIAMRFFLRGIHQKIPSDESAILLRQIGNQLPELSSSTLNISFCLPDFYLVLRRVTIQDSGFYTTLQMSEIGELSLKYVKLIVNGSANNTTPTPPTTTTPAATTTTTKVYADCQAVYDAGMTTSGVYKISPDGSTVFEVYCEQELDGGGWAVFQRRMDGSVDFYRDWADYLKGFGNLTTEFWLGNDYIHLLSAKRDQKLKVELDYHGEVAYADYSRFWLSDPETEYYLHVDGFSGANPPGDSFVRGYRFTTRDHDHDMWIYGNCAQRSRSAWWYELCTSGLNGVYGNNSDSRWNIRWYSYKREEAMTGTRMMCKRGQN